MEIISPETKHTVYDYDLTFAHGNVLPFTIDPNLGDTINFLESAIIVHRGPRETIPTEDLTIFLQHVAVVSKREREIIELTQEQKDQYLELVKELSQS